MSKSLFPAVSSARLSLLQLSIAGALWGTTGVVVQIVAGSTGLGAVAIGFYRLAIAAAVMLILGFPARRQLVLAFRAAPVATTLAGVGLATYQALYLIAVRMGGVSIATVVSLGIAPVLLSAWETLRTRRRPGAATLGASAAAIAGLILIALATFEPSTAAGATVEPSAAAGATVEPNTTAGATVEPDATAGATVEPNTAAGAAVGPGVATAGLGLLAAVASGTVYAASTALSRHTAQGVPPLMLTTLSCGIGAITLLPIAAAEGLRFAPEPAPIALLVYAGAVTTALAYALFYTGLRRTTGSVAVVVTLLEPLTAALLAVLLIGEPLGGATIAGGSLLLGAVATLYLGAGKQAEAPATQPVGAAS